MKRAIRKHLRDFVALIVLFLISIGVSGFIIYNQDARPAIPLLEPTPKVLNFEMSDAQAVTPGQGQSVRVAGVQVGKIVAVRPRNGVALVKTEIEPKFWDVIHVKTDATGLLRPRTGLKDMFIELDPGGQGKDVPDGYTLPVENNAPDIDPDEFLSAFDTDTRSYLQLLINGAGKGLKGRGDDLNKVFKALGPTQHDLTRVTKAIARRRGDLKELIHRYGDLTNTLADNDREIKTLVTASDAVFKAFASQDQNISSAVSKLPPTLTQTTRTLTKANAYAKLLGPTLDSLRPPFRQLATTNQEIIPFMREAYPITKNHIRPFVQDARPFVNDLRPAAKQLARATPDFAASFHELNRFFNMAAYNPNGAEPLYPTLAQNNTKRDEGYLYWASWVVMNTDSMFSTSDSTGPFRRALFGLSCDTIKNQLAANPAAGPLLGLVNAINDPVLCGNPANPSPLDVLPLPKKTQSKAGAGGGSADAATSGQTAAQQPSGQQPATGGSTPAGTQAPLPDPQGVVTQGTLPKSLGKGR
ncbi:MAG: phospholipid/cholesterol/gamma-HCH transport system substrate-binding protein [Thermoleophilaceae bacterium]|nr:phospholipid/cholesterol/gamma-HCH transport system substrate-binding protein [Thermoleophilaceae bacterium]